MTPDMIRAVSLPTRLRIGAKGCWDHEAAVELLIAHDVWLRRPDFVGRCLDLFGVGGEEVAIVCWDLVDRFLETAGCSASDSRMLRIAAELAGTDTGIALGELIAGVDDRNIGLVLDAVAHSAGWHAYPRTYTVTGRVAG